MNSKKQPHNNTVCDGYLVTEKYVVVLDDNNRKHDGIIERVLLSDVLYINGLSLRSLPFSKRVQELYREIVEPIKSLQKDLEVMKQTGFRSVEMRDFWPLKELKKLEELFIPSLLHESEGLVLLDPSSTYCYGDQPSHMWKYEKQ